MRIQLFMLILVIQWKIEFEFVVLKEFGILVLWSLWVLPAPICHVWVESLSHGRFPKKSGRIAAVLGPLG